MTHPPTRTNQEHPTGPAASGSGQVAAGHPSGCRCSTCERVRDAAYLRAKADLDAGMDQAGWDW